MMHRKILTIALAVFALVLAASPALAAKAPHRYSPKHGAKCRKHYKRVKHGKKAYCVKKKAKAKKKAAPASAQLLEKTKLHSHLDPTFTRDPLNPFKVTYAFSASATQETFSAQDVRLGDESASLPSGVLSLFSDGKLECAVNVGGGIEGSECPVSYQALGTHSVTTIYTSGEQSATETETEDIGPLATTTTLSVSYTPIAAQEDEEVEPGTGLYHIGDLAVSVSATPAAVTSRLGCGEGSGEHLTSSGCYQIESAVEHVYGVTHNGSTPCLGSFRISKETGWERVINGAEPLAASALEAGAYHFRASVTAGNGYSASEATAPIQFAPEVSFEPNC